MILSITTELIEQKLHDLERRLEAVEMQSIPYSPMLRPKGSWKAAVGTEMDDEVFREATRLGAEWRAKANSEGH